MAETGTNPLQLLRQHGLEDAKEVHTYIGEIYGLGPVRLRVLDSGATDRRWTVEVYDETDNKITEHEDESLDTAVSAVFQTIKARIG